MLDDIKKKKEEYKAVAKTPVFNNNAADNKQDNNIKD